MIRKIASDAVLEEAFAWLCRRREHYSWNNDVWDLCANWRRIKLELRDSLLSGAYTFQPLRELRIGDEIIELWSSMDALVLKAMAIVLGERLGRVISRHCYHTADRGGAKAAVRKTCEALGPGLHVMKSDVKSYYATMNHQVLMALITRYIPDAAVLRLLGMYLKRTVTFGGNYREVTEGISLGCPLSSLMGAVYLSPLDDAMEKSGLFYARFMDDWLILAPTRWKLRRAIRTVRRVLHQLKAAMHPDKTFIGRASGGFDFLGYHFAPGRIDVSRPAISRFAERVARLYEQGADHFRVEQYVRRWVGWTLAGVAGLLRSPMEWKNPDPRHVPGFASSGVGGCAECPCVRGSCARFPRPCEGRPTWGEN